MNVKCSSEEVKKEKCLKIMDLFITCCLFRLIISIFSRVFSNIFSAKAETSQGSNYGDISMVNRAIFGAVKQRNICTMFKLQRCKAVTRKTSFILFETRILFPSKLEPQNCSTTTLVSTSTLVSISIHNLRQP